jgi:hypothetical protein
MALNLLRNSRVFFTSKVDSTTGVVPTSGFATTDTQEIQVLEGFSFSQNTNSDTITINEAGSTPTRGQRTFNTSLAPVDFSFSTYIRPYKSTNVKAEESVLWNALTGFNAKNTALTKSGTFTSIAYDSASNTTTIAGSTMSVTGLAVGDDVVINGLALGTGTDAAAIKQVSGPARVATSAAGSITFKMHNPSSTDIATGVVAVTNIDFYKTSWSEATTQAIVSLVDSNRNQLQKFGMIIIVDSVTYKIDNAAMGQVMIDFGLDGIATAQWTGQATAISQLTTNATATAGAFGGGLSGSYAQKDSTTTNYITNKLSTAKLKTAKLLGTIVAGTEYYVAITGGSVTINNNINYITPAVLGIVNTPAAYFTGTRAISGSLNAYLNTGTASGYTGGGTGNLLKDILSAASSVTEPMFNLEIAIGGGSNALRVELQMPSVSLGVPTIDAQAVISTAINFTAAPSSLTGTATSDAYDVARTNELTVRYYTA